MVSFLYSFVLSLSHRVQEIVAIFVFFNEGWPKTAYLMISHVLKILVSPIKEPTLSGRWIF
jgi:hypothetical protein